MGAGAMTRANILRMAREAGFAGWLAETPFVTTCFEHFAALVAAAERERMKSEGWRQCAKGQRTTQYCGLLEDSVKAEREACAKLCEEIAKDNDAEGADIDWVTGNMECADYIRARGQ